MVEEAKSTDDEIVEKPRLREPHPRKPCALASKFSIFTVVPLSWVVLTNHMVVSPNTPSALRKDWPCAAWWPGIAVAISLFTIRVLGRPLKLLEAGIVSVAPRAARAHSGEPHRRRN